MAYAEGRDTDVVYRDGMRGVWHGSRNGRNVGRNARRMPNEGLAGTFYKSTIKD